MRCKDFLTAEEVQRMQSLLADGSTLCVFADSVQRIGCGGIVGAQADLGMVQAEFEPLMMRFLCPNGTSIEQFENAVWRRSGLGRGALPRKAGFVRKYISRVGVCVVASREYLRNKIALSSRRYASASRWLLGRGSTVEKPESLVLVQNIRASISKECDDSC